VAAESIDSGNAERKLRGLVHFSHNAVAGVEAGVATS
jgi:hypothetical protein